MLLTDQKRQLIKKNQIHTVKYLPFTEEKIKEFSVGEIKTPASCLRFTDINDIIRAYQKDCESEKLTIFSNRIFGNRTQELTKSSLFNFAHIDLGFPIVMPDKYAIKTKNQIKTMLNLSGKDCFSKVLEYDGYLLIPRNDQSKSGFLYQMLKDPIYKEDVDFFTIHLLTNELSRDFPLLTFDSKKPSDKCISTYMFDRVNMFVVTDRLVLHKEILDNFVPVQGAYALAVLMGFIDFNFYIENFDTLSYHATTKEPLGTFKEHLDFVKSTISEDKGTLIDYITTIVPVIPAVFRDLRFEKQGNKDVVDIPAINKLYNTILQNKSICQADVVSHKDIYNITQLALHNFKMVNYNIHDAFSYYTKLILFLESLFKIDKSIIAERKNLQAEIRKYTISKDSTSAYDKGSNVTQLDRLSSKYGLLRDKSAAKRIDRTFRGVITVNPQLTLNYIGIPFQVVLKWFKKEVLSSVKQKFGRKVTRDDVMLYQHISHLSTSNINRIVSKGSYGDVTYIPEEEKDINTQILDHVVFKLEELTKDKRVLIIRYPSLHKYNELCFKIQIVMGSAVQFHPLVVQSYNADFDGDQVSGFLIETSDAVKDADSKLLPIRNVSNARGEPLLSPSQEAILGLYYLTVSFNDIDTYEVPAEHHFPSYDSMHNAYLQKKIKLHDIVTVNYPVYTSSIYKRNFTAFKYANIKLENTKPEDVLTLNYKPATYQATDHNPLTASSMSVNTPQIPPTQIRNDGLYRNITSTVGRFIFNSIIPQNLGYTDREENAFDLEISNTYFKQNKAKGLSGKLVKAILKTVITKVNDERELAYIHDKFKEVGYHYATISGFSLSLSDLKTSKEKEVIINSYKQQIKQIENDSSLTQKEKDDIVVELWIECTDKVTQACIDNLEPTNPLMMMIGSGSRGNASQVAQLVGMRGIMKDSSGNAIKTPIENNFIDGITASESICASYGACKGIIDKGNSTKDTGELTRKAIFGLNDLVIQSGDCGDREGINIRRSPEYVFGYKDTVGNLYNQDKDTLKLRPIFLNAQTVKILPDFPILDVYGNIYIHSYIPPLLPDAQTVGDEKIIVEAVNKNPILDDYREIPIYNIKYNRVLSREFFTKALAKRKLSYHDRLQITNLSPNQIELQIYINLETTLYLTIDIDENRNHYISSIKTNTYDIFDLSTTTNISPIHLIEDVQIVLSDTAFNEKEIIYLNGETINSKAEVKLSNGDIKVSYDKELLGEIKTINILDDIYGRYTVYDIKDENNNVIIKADRMISRKDIPVAKLEKLINLYPEGIFVRSPLTCKSRICSKCYGFNFSTNLPAKVGDAVGLTSAHTIGELISQGALRTFHTGGAANAGDIIDTFKNVNNLIVNGRIDSKIMHKMLNITDIGINLETSQEVTQNEFPKIFSYNDKEFASNLPTGKALISNPINQAINPVTLEMYGVTNYFTYTNSSLAMLETIKSIFSSGGNSILSVYYEVMITKMFSTFRVVSGGDSSYFKGDIVTFKDLLETNIQLAKAGLSPILVTPSFTTIRECASPASNPTLAILNGNLKKNISLATTHRRGNTMDSDTITSVLNGRKFPTGKKQVENSMKKCTEELPTIKYKEDLLTASSNRKQELLAKAEEFIKSTVIDDSSYNLSFLFPTPPTSSHTTEDLYADLNLPTLNINDTTTDTHIEPSTEQTIEPSTPQTTQDFSSLESLDLSLSNNTEQSITQQQSNDFDMFSLGFDIPTPSQTQTDDDCPFDTDPNETNTTENTPSSNTQSTENDSSEFNFDLNSLGF